jgi:AraC-like DNA-binding protein
MSPAVHHPVAKHPSVPVAYACQLLDLVDALGGSGAALWAELGLDSRSLHDPMARIALGDYTALNARALARCGEPGLGYLLGLRASPASHGTLAFGMLSQATLGDALLFGVRLGGPLRTAGWLLHLVEGVPSPQPGMEPRVHLRLSESLAPARPAALREHAARHLLTSMATLLGHVLPGCRHEMQLHFEGPEPPWQHRHADQLPPCHFQQPFPALSLPQRLMHHALPQANVSAARWAEQACLDELARLGETTGQRVLRQTQALLATSGQGHLSASEVAMRLGMSVRTLSRTLHHTGWGFQALLRQARQRDALALLQVPGMRVADVAAWLGYRSVSAFCSAFQGWTGQAPAALLQSAQRADWRPSCGPVDPDHPETFQLPR